MQLGAAAGALLRSRAAAAALALTAAGLAGGAAFSGARAHTRTCHLATAEDALSGAARAHAEAAAPTTSPPAGAVARTPAVALTRAWDANWDRRGDLTHGITRTLYLVRHGQYANMDAHDDAAHVLTPLGCEQAKATGARLRVLLADTAVVAITHSTMARAAETAALIAESFPGVPLRPCELLREGAPVRPEPDTWQPSEASVWEDGARIEAAFRKHFHRADAATDAGGKSVAAPVEIVVCHGNIIRFCVLRALQLPPEAWLRLALANGSVTKLSLRSGGHVSLHGLGDTGHFPPRLITHN